jgi:cobalt/nickel transport system ATP-binding protein
MVEVENIEVVYPGSHEGHVLEGVSLNVAPSERVALIGANGAGKSTLLLTLVGILPLHGGRIKINGINLEKSTLSRIRRSAGLIFQNPDDQLFMSTVWEDVLFGPLNYHAEDKAQREVAAALSVMEKEALQTLETLGIAALKDKLSHKLSGGEKRLAALASVLVMKPDVLLLDEPSTFLDPRARRRIIDILKNIDKTIILATHDLEMVRELCPRSIVLSASASAGGIRADGSTEEILADARLLDEAGL